MVVVCAATVVAAGLVRPLLRPVWALLRLVAETIELVGVTMLAGCAITGVTALSGCTTGATALIVGATGWPVGAMAFWVLGCPLAIVGAGLAGGDVFTCAGLLAAPVVPAAEVCWPGAPAGVPDDPG